MTAQPLKYHHPNVFSSFIRQKLAPPKCVQLCTMASRLTIVSREAKKIFITHKVTLFVSLICLKMHVGVLTKLCLAKLMPTSTFPQDFSQLLFNRGAYPPQAPP